MLATARMLSDAPDNWINVRMKALLAEDFCPSCGKHNKLHDDNKCEMRWNPEEDNEQL